MKITDVNLQPALSGTERQAVFYLIEFECQKVSLRVFYEYIRWYSFRTQN